MKYSTRLYVIAMLMAVMQVYDRGGLSLGIWALIALVVACVCEGTEEWERQQSRHKD